jgi:hypothetical protein
MQRWQRRAHLWLWLVIGAVVTTVLVVLIEDQPRLGEFPSGFHQP